MAPICQGLLTALVAIINPLTVNEVISIRQALS